ncbi:related to Som1 protein [Rhynchosporium secalis]|uniref:Related to Som1 protein n=1 Tax=Rhynchosporium secalis TaxID=38038 RepID=A0A1E1LXQ9_RHYSE|nr:related to Som1 protein [Rhynchosporium secalis]
MNNINMGGMNPMAGGPVGGGMPMMNNGAGARPQPMPPTNNDQRSQLNTYIYEYFLRNGMYDCARSLLNSQQPINVEKHSPGGNRENGTGDEGDGDSKDDIDSKQPNDLPNPAIPKECPESCFLYEWWCLFWDMFNAQRGKGEARSVLQYVNHTQSQSRLKQDHQQQVLRGLRPDVNMTQAQYQALMLRNPAAGNGMNLNQNELRHKAIQNNNRNATPQQLQMLAQQQAQKQQQMQRDPSEGNNQQRPQSPGSADNAPSPSKRPRIDGTPFNPQQMPNGRAQAGGMPQQVGDTGPSNAIHTAHVQLANGIEPNNLTAQQFQNMPGGGPNTQQKLAGYQANLAQQQAGQMPGVRPMPNPNGPQNQGSPMMAQGQDGAAIANYYNPQDPNRMQGGPGGAPGGGGGNHALQDYQMQLMLLEQQNKKRLMMARQEQDNMMPRTEGGQGGPGPVGPNGQPFQQGTSPQGPRSVNSPNPGDQMKRGTPHMNNAGMPSPLPEGQSRGSPSAGMNFNLPGGQMDQGMNQQYFKMNGMDPNMAGNMAGVMPNGMRPPSSHPGGFNGQMTPQQIAMARQQQQQQAQQNWGQAGPNGQMMPQPNQGGGPQQTMGTPQQRAMPPPSAPAVNPAANGRTQPPSPQQNPAPPTPSQTNKANPKKKAEAKDNKKRPNKKGSTANLNAGATPSADADNAGATPTPATPITPVHPKAFGNGAVQPVTNGQPPAPANTGVVNQQSDPLQGGGLSFDSSGFDFPGGMDFANPNNGNMDVLQDFDFDSFLHQDGEGVDNFNFDSSAFLDGNEIGAD